MTADHITDAELLLDILATESEAQAYSMISSGHGVLARLRSQPQNQQNIHEATARTNYLLMMGCRELLERLNKIKTERGL
jgi:hypothetical protein